MNGNLAYSTDFLTVVGYLEGEEEAEERHEYVDGKVHAMAGANENHEIVAGNIFAALLAHLRGKKGRVFKGDMKVRLQLNKTDLFYYPDAMVVCDPSDTQPVYKQKPRLIVEVMSDYKSDHVEKLFAYQQIESLEEYLVIHQEPGEMKAWLYRKDRNWMVSDGAPEGKIHLESIGLTVSLSELYVME